MDKTSKPRPKFVGLCFGCSLSSGLCHGRCACMAGHNSNKKYIFFVLRGFARGFARVLPSCVPCPAFSLFDFYLVSSTERSLCSLGNTQKILSSLGRGVPNNHHSLEAKNS